MRKSLSLKTNLKKNYVNISINTISSSDNKSKARNEKYEAILENLNLQHFTPKSSVQSFKRYKTALRKGKQKKVEDLINDNKYYVLNIATKEEGNLKCNQILSHKQTTTSIHRKDESINKNKNININIMQGNTMENSLPNKLKLNPNYNLKKEPKELNELHSEFKVKLNQLECRLNREKLNFLNETRHVKISSNIKTLSNCFDEGLKSIKDSINNEKEQYLASRIISEIRYCWMNFVKHSFKLNLEYKHQGIQAIQEIQEIQAKQEIQAEDANIFSSTNKNKNKNMHNTDYSNSKDKEIEKLNVKIKELEEKMRNEQEEKKEFIKTQEHILEKNNFENERYKQYTNLLHNSCEEAIKDKDTQLFKIHLDRIQEKEKNSKLLDENNDLTHKCITGKQKIKLLKEKIKSSLFHVEKYYEHIQMIFEDYFSLKRKYDDLMNSFIQLNARFKKLNSNYEEALLYKEYEKINMRIEGSVTLAKSIEDLPDIRNLILIPRKKSKQLPRF